MSSKALSLSILIPVYNVAEYVEACLESILKQINARAEIILMNDAATDNSDEIISRYHNHPQVQILQAPHNRGLSATRNALLQVATGEYVWFIDSDDVMHEGAYNAVISQLQALRSDILCADYVSLRGTQEVSKKAFIGAANKNYNNTHNSFINNIIKNNSNHVWNKVFKRTLIQNLSFKEGVNFEDIYYMTDVALKDFTYSYLNQPVIKYRERAGSIVQNLDEKYVDNYLEAFIYRIEHYQKCHEIDNNYHYLLYKVYKRYAGLLKKIDKNNQPTLLKYTYDKYHDCFLAYYLSVIKKLPFHQKTAIYLKNSKTKTIIKSIKG